MNQKITRHQTERLALATQRRFFPLQPSIPDHRYNAWRYFTRLEHPPIEARQAAVEMIFFEPDQQVFVALTEFIITHGSSVDKRNARNLAMLGARDFRSGLCAWYLKKHEQEALATVLLELITQITGIEEEASLLAIGSILLVYGTEDHHRTITFSAEPGRDQAEKFAIVMRMLESVRAIAHT